MKEAEIYKGYQIQKITDPNYLLSFWQAIREDKSGTGVCSWDWSEKDTRVEHLSERALVELKYQIDVKQDRGNIG